MEFDRRYDTNHSQKLKLGGMISLRRECMILLLVFAFAAMPLSLGKENLDKPGDSKENVSTDIKKTYEDVNGIETELMPGEGSEIPKPCATPSFDALLSLICLFGTILILNWRR